MSAEELTRGNTKLTLTVAANYGGRWDILQAVAKAQQEKLQSWRALQAKNAANGAPVLEFDLSSPDNAISEPDLARHLCMAYAPEPDLFIRTGGEARVSNFLLWQLAYTEFYFTSELWPDFGRASIEKAFESYRQRERRFGRTSEQVQAASGASLVQSDAA